MVEKNVLIIKVKQLVPVLCAIPSERYAQLRKGVIKLVQSLSFSLLPGSLAGFLSPGALRGDPLALTSCSITQALPHPPQEFALEKSFPRLHCAGRPGSWGGRNDKLDFSHISFKLEMWTGGKKRVCVHICMYKLYKFTKHTDYNIHRNGDSSVYK